MSFPGAAVFSAFASDHLAVNCLVAGANALLSKAALGTDLCDAVRAVAHGRRALGKIPQQLVGLLSRRLDDSEQLLLGMLAAGLTRGEIMAVLRVSNAELEALEDSTLFKLEALPGEFKSFVEQLRTRRAGSSRKRHGAMSRSPRDLRKHRVRARQASCSRHATL